MAESVGTSSSRASNATGSIPMTTTSTPSQVNSESLWRLASNDVGWEYGYCEDITKRNVVTCTLCHTRVSTCGITRLKEHVAGIKGNVAPCKKANDEAKAKCKKSLLEGKEKKNALNVHDIKVREEVHLRSQDEEEEDDIGNGGGDEEEEEEEVKITGAKKRKNIRGPMDRFASSIHPPTDVGKKRKQQVINDAFGKERTQSVHEFLARWVYENGIPFHALDNDSFRRFCEAVGQYGPGYKPPSQYELREPLLNKEVEITKKALKNQEYEWAKTGCSIMTDAWSDGKRISIMNLCVNCKKGTTFLSSKEASNDSHTGEYIFTYIENCIQEVGPQNVIQVVTDNASNNMAAAKNLQETRPHIFWNSCATHTINIMLQGIGNIPKFQVIIEKAKTFTVFIYSHHKTLAMMRNCTKKKDLVRSGVTRFATSSLTLQSLNNKKHLLRLLFASKEWEESKYSKTLKGKAVFATIMSMSFWNGVSLCLQVFEPLVKVLRLVDGDKRPSMGFLYGELQEARKEIKEVYNNQEATYAQILEIMDLKARDRLDGPLHLAAYFFNPYYFFKDEGICLNGDVMQGCICCTEHFFPDDDQSQETLMNVELPKYRNKEGVFGRNLAKSGCAKKDFDPVAWWYTYGNSVPHLQKMAIRILSLTTSSSGCERNWSTFQGIHTKKRNRLDATRMSKLVYVQFNSKIINKNRRKNIGEVLLAREAREAQEWLVENNGIEDMEMQQEASEVDSELREVRELYEDDFASKDEDEGN
ncbi:uncharacterized protein LOC126803514 [Argentina anserina]|uniref:uncharacterized protein LOC126803514 n=1 Tax=Argentina anserina TaxID=57926 RepID=UPI00217671FC|nr:uncharacterized protein LOC126803514 [Potentilla anserina]